MNRKLGTKIAEGGCAEVFEWENGKIIKLAKANTSSWAVRREYRNNWIVWNLGLPVAKTFELLEVENRLGIIMERVYGETLLVRFLKQALSNRGYEVNENEIQQTARIFSEIHDKTNIDQLPLQKDVLKLSINRVEYLTSAEKETVISNLEAFSSKQLLCHGDLNPNNMIIQDDGKIVVIDWMNASIGNSEADIAEYIIMIRYAILPPNLPTRFLAFFDSKRETIISIFMDEYAKLTGITYDEVKPWIVPVAARKLSADAISEEEKTLLVQAIRRNLCQEL